MATLVATTLGRPFSGGFHAQVALFVIYRSSDVRRDRGHCLGRQHWTACLNRPRTLDWLYKAVNLGNRCCRLRPSLHFAPGQASVPSASL